jgi:hypothetical protein
MAAERVAVLYEGSLLAEGVRSLLDRIAGLHTTAIAAGTDDAAERLAALAPTVVIVDLADEAFRSRTAFDLLEPIRDVRLLCLHGGDHVDVYRKRRVELGGSRDLAAAIRAP